MQVSGYSKPDSRKDNSLPDSPEHQLSRRLDYTMFHALGIGFSSNFRSEWHIYPVLKR